MSVLVETSLGDLVIDLHTEQAPKSCENFLKLCKIKYYNYAPVFNVQKGFSFQSGDPLGPDSKESTGGSSIWGVLAGSSRSEFEPEFHPKLKHQESGTVSMATAATVGAEKRTATSQFIVTLADSVEYLDGKGAVFGKVVEGFDVLQKINEAFVDNKGRPLRDIRVKHTVVLDDPFPDPPGLVEPPKSPVPTPAQLATVRIADDEKIDDDLDEEAMEELRRQREAKAQALTLEMVGDLPFAEVKPPENVLFVCKLNPVTQDDDLELIFSRFGKVLSCEVIRDKKTGDSLQYAFVEFERKEDCEQAFFKMQDVLIDDHRIHVDFSQSVSRLSDTWRSATNIKRRNQANYGGFAGLERRRQYRNVEEDNADEYDLVSDHGRQPERERSHRPEAREYRRSRSPHRRNGRSRSPRAEHRDPRKHTHARDRRREPDRGHHRDEYGGDRSRERYRHQDRRYRS